MSAWWEGLPLLQQFFYVMAIPGTILLVLQTILLLIGLGHGDGDVDHEVDHDLDHDFDHDMDHDFDHDVDHDIGHDMDHGTDHDADHDGDHDHANGLRLFSVRGIVAFFAIGGWTGVALLDGGLPEWLASVLAVAAGVAAMVLVAAVLALLSRMQQSGNLDMRNAVGLTGEVYIPIPADGKGKITLILQERFTEADAICPEGALKTGQPVVVLDVAENNLLVVKPIIQS